jgi:archaetidylinositol phosphate synthase
MASLSTLGVFESPTRVHRALTAKAERRLLIWLAERMPRWINSDHLTVLGFFAQIMAGVCYALSRHDPKWLWAVCIGIVLNWLGDSTDGTLARVRQQQRPRYGFYVDHIIDAFGSAALMIGLGLSGYAHWQVAVTMLISFLLVSMESFLASYTLGHFHLSHGLFGPTEVRILLIIGSLRLLIHPEVHLLGHEWLLFDVGGVTASIGMVGMALWAAAKHTAELYRLERVG